MLKKLIKNLFAGAMLMAPAVVQATPTEVPDIYGSVIFAVGWEYLEDAPYGMYAIQDGKGMEPKEVKIDEKLFANGGGVYADGLYHLVQWNEYIDGYEVIYRVYDVENDWKLLFEKNLPSIKSIASDLTYNPVDGKIYGCFNNGFGGYYLGTLDELTGESHKIGNLQEAMLTLSANTKGELFGVGEYGNLYKIDSKDAKITTIGATGKTIRYAQSATFDYPTNRLYWVMTPHEFMDEVKLCEINTTDATVTEISALPDRYEFTGLFTKSPYAAPEAPAAVQNVNINFPKGTLDGKIEFQLPTTTSAGAPIEKVDYEIYLDGEVLSHTKESGVGALVSQQCTFEEKGLHYVKITPRNEAGRGQAFATYFWVGVDTPKAVDPAFTFTETTATITWKAPTEGIYGGYIDPSKLSYRVLRQPGDVVVYKGTATTATDDISEVGYDYHRYDIETYLDGVKGETAHTAAQIFGKALSCPYTEDFANYNAIDLFSVLDVNNDHNTWHIDEEMATYGWNDGVNADDWLITPPIRLEKDYAYQLSYDLSKEPYYTETIEVAMGNQPTVEGMKETILPPTDFNDDNKPATEHLILAKEDQNTHFGFHILSKYESGAYIYLDNITVEKIAHVAAPQAPILQITAGEKGAKEATISHTLPTLAIDGTALTEVTDVKIYRDNQLIQTFTDEKPGQQVLWIDRDARVGMNTYKAVASNAHGQGLEAEATVYIGQDAPSKVENITINDLGNGQVQLTWEAPTIGKNGGYVDPDNLSYTVYNIGGDLNAYTTTQETTLSDQIILKDNKQEIIWYTITARNTIGSGVMTSSDTIFLGDAYSLPYKESFKGRGLDGGPWSFGKCDEFEWDIAGYGIYCDPQDRDGGMAQFAIMEGPGGIASLVSPKLSLAKDTDTEIPYLTFYVWHHVNADNRLRVSIRTDNGIEKEIDYIDQGDTKSQEWKQYSYNLSEFIQSEYVQIIFTGINISADVYKVNELYVDNISLLNIHPNDLSASTLTSEQTAIEAGSVVEFTFAYENRGYQKAENYSIQLLRDGEEVASIEGEPIEAGKTARINLKDTPDTDIAKSIIYTAVIDYESDGNTSNNTSTQCIISILPTKPAPSNLVGNGVGNDVILTWDAPIGGQAKEVTESFENYEAFIINHIGEWTLVDGDEANSAGIIANGEWLEYPNAQDPAAYQVFNPSQVGLNAETWKPHTGKQVLAAFTTVYKPNSDWLISPRVDGKQTISFWAKSPDNTAFGSVTTEQIDVLYSTTTKDTTAFKKIGNTIQVPGMWQEYQVELPEGTKYFAIHHISNNQYILFLDDITYRTAPMNEAIDGYNIYRDGEKVNEELVTAMTYTDEDVVLNTPLEYYVTAVYGEVESKPSNTVQITATAINETEGKQPMIRTAYGVLYITQTGQQYVQVYTIDGVRIHTAQGDTSVALPIGIYIVRIGTQTYKVSL